MISVTSSSSPIRKGLTEAMRLQSETEYFTRKLETEKRKTMLLDQEITEAKALFSGRQRHLRNINTKREREPAQLMKIKRIEETIRAYEIKTNQVKTECRELRNQIDSFRKLKISSERYRHRLNSELDRVHSEARLAKAEVNRSTVSLRRNMSCLTEIKDDMMSSRSKFSQSSKMLGSKIEHEKWRRTQDLHMMQGMTSSLSKAEVTEGLILSRHLLKRWKQTVKLIAQDLEAQQSHSERIHYFFETVKEQSSICEFEEVVKVVKKTVEDEAVLSKYNNSLLEEVEKIKLELARAQYTIDNRIENETRSEQELLLQKDELTAALNKATANFTKHQAHIEALECDLGEMTGNIDQLKKLMSPWLEQPADWEDKVTFSNIVKYLQNLEDQFTVFLLAVELKRKAPHPELAMLDLSMLTPASNHQAKRSEIVRQVTYQSRKLNVTH